MFPHSLPDNILKQNHLTPISDNKTYNLTGLKVISLNCQSIRSTARRARLHALVYEHSPNIIIGCESQIDNSYSSTEVFPPGYCVLRKDHCEGAGGVFICIKENLSASAIPSLDTDAEIIWAKIDISKRNPIFICSFYRPPNNLLQPLVKLHESLSELLNSNVSLPCIILATYQVYIGLMGVVSCSLILFMGMKLILYS